MLLNSELIQEYNELGDPFAEIENPGNLKGTSKTDWISFKWDDPSCKEVLYRGEMVSGRIHGKGCIYRTVYNDIVAGYFESGRLCRHKCLVISPSLSVYLGPLNEANRRHGWGKISSKGKGARRYEGQFKDGHMSGLGSLQVAGALYKGEFVEDRITVGRMTSDKAMYEGSFQKMKPHGMGLLVWKEGGKFVGEFKNGKMQGRGVLYDKEGKMVRLGYWVDGHYALLRFDE